MQVPGFGGCHPLPTIIFIVCGPVAKKFCTGIDNQSISSNMAKICMKLKSSSINYIRFQLCFGPCDSCDRCDSHAQKVPHRHPNGGVR